MNHEGKIVLVTGGAGGIGAATVQRLAHEGAFVYLGDIDAQGGESLAENLREGGAKVEYIHLNVADPESWTEASQYIARTSGRLDGLVNNAGIADVGEIEDVTFDRYRQVVAVTQDGVFLGMQSCSTLLGRETGSSVVNVSSIFGISGGQGDHPAYHAAKGAVRTLTKNTAIAWAPRGIRVNSVHPGFVATPMTSGADLDHLASACPMQRVAQPEEIAGVISFLLSADASFITGSEVVVDGGLLAQ